MNFCLDSFTVLKHKFIRRFKCQKGLWMERLGFYSELSWEGYQPVFIISTGRTGTTFLGGYFFNQFDNVLAYHEPQPDFYDLGVEMARGNTDELKTKKIITANRKWVLKELDKKSARYYIEANHYLFSLIPIIKEIFPRPKFVHIVRDGREVLRSAYNRGWYRPASSYDYLKATDFSDDSFFESWDNLSRFEKIAWYWQKKDRYICDILKEENNSLRIYFENIFDAENNYAGMEKLINFLGLPSKKFRDYLKNKIRSSKSYELPHWTDWEDERKEKFNNIAGEHLKYHGYSWGN